MFLLEPEPTGFDLNWRMFGVRVRVHPLFWLVTLILGWPVAGEGDVSLTNLLIWVGCVFVSILAHEWGHVGAGLGFGAHGHIVLYSFGGLAVGSSNLRSRWQRMVVYLAGPLAGFLLLGLVLLALTVLNPSFLPVVLEETKGMLGLPYRLSMDFREPLPWVRRGIEDLVWINLFWGLLNLLPVWPLDGGQVSREVFDEFAPGRGVRLSLMLSVVTGALFAILFWKRGQGYSAFFFAMLALNSFINLRQAGTGLPSGRGDRWERGRDSRETWGRDPDYWK